MRIQCSDPADIHPSLMTSPEGCTDAGLDSFEDLTLKFKAKDILSVLRPVSAGDFRVLHLTGSMMDGTPLEDVDVVIIK